MTSDSGQLEMLGGQGVTVSADLQQEMARGCRDRHHALVKCYEASNLTAKQVYKPLGIDQGVFSRILGGTAFLDPCKKFDWMRVCGNIIPVRYDALCVKHELVPMRTNDQERIAELQAQLDDERRINRRLAEMIRK